MMRKATLTIGLFLLCVSPANLLVAQGVNLESHDAKLNMQATELRTAVSKLPPRARSLQAQFQQQITVAEQKVAQGNHAEAARALQSIGDTVLRTPDTRLASRDKLAILQPLDQFWRRVGIRQANPHTIRHGCKCSNNRCVEDPEGGICSEGQDSRGRWSCASAP